MAVPNIDKLTYKQLLDLEARIADAIVARKNEERADVKRKMAELAAKSGFEMEELMGAKKGGRGKRGKVAPKYRHPQDTSLTWTGRGRQPLWLVAELKKGKKLNSILIK